MEETRGPGTVRDDDDSAENGEFQEETPEHVSSADPHSGSSVEEAEQWKDKYIRLLADFDNYRKRMGREQEDSRKFANESLLKSFLPILDNLERALFHFEKVDSPSTEVKALVEGVKLTEKQFLELLEKNHVTRIPAQGEVFDPNVHEAMGFSTSVDHKEGTIVDVYQQGYMLQGRLLRPSLVTVAQKKEAETGS
ncbi:MAG: nucleotide exchange factor GrpE [Leptospirillum sp.]